METPEEFVGSNDQIHTPLKGRRTKRLRLNSGGADASSSSSSGGGCGGGGEEFASSSISGEIVDHQEISTEEEEDMANCLILLAQGDGRPRQILEEAVKMERISTKRFNYEKAGFYVYECKTCNRTFPSFQALGGHRASHKKPKPPITAVAVVEEKIKKLPTTTTTTLVGREEPEEPQFNKILPTAAVQIPNKPVAANLQAKKIHECSICGLEFTSGQALGGHMRRHRAVASAQVVAMNTDHHHHHNISSSAMETKMKQRNILELDLNLPAPEEDLRDTKFQFTPTPQTIVFSAPTLVDCHY